MCGPSVCALYWGCLARSRMVQWKPRTWSSSSMEENLQPNGRDMTWKGTQWCLGLVVDDMTLIGCEFCLYREIMCIVIKKTILSLALKTDIRYDTTQFKNQPNFLCWSSSHSPWHTWEIKCTCYRQWLICKIILAHWGNTQKEPKRSDSMVRTCEYTKVKQF